jgi:hypothetical protein
VLCALLLAGAGLATGCSSGGSKQPAEAEKQPHADPIKAVVALPKGQGIVAQRGWAIGPITTSARQLFWTAASSDETSDVLLLKRDLVTGRTRVAAHRLFQAFGLASAAGSVVYATRSGKHAQLASRPIAGGRPTVLSNDLAAPFDGRGDMLAWAEADGSQNRVLVRDMRKGRTSVAYSGARCRQTRCYRIDRVTVADDGVVFDLGAVGQGYPSLIVRRGWHAKHPEVVRVPRDPQPDLARSSSGAVYYQLGRGWMEWDFRRARPAPTWPHGLRPWLLSRDANRDLVLRGPTCSTMAAVHIGSRIVAARAPRATPVSAKGFGKLCRQLAGFAWSGNRLLLAWTLTPRISIEAHEEIGVSSVITSNEIG